jgi:hypothetical protein
MTRFFLLISFIVSINTYSQIQNESQIPFTLDTDNDAVINVIDIDDDNDGVLDNLDYAPLNASQSSPTILNTTVTTTIDAGLRNNTSSNANTNYGSDPSAQTKNADRSLIFKFTQPANLNLANATLTFYTSTENDPLNIYSSSSTWTENVITYNNYLPNFNNKVLLGITPVPTGGKYTYDLPLNIFNYNGGPFSLIVYDANDPSGATESLITSDDPNSPYPSVQFNYYEPVTPRLIINQSTGIKHYVAGPNINVGFKLTQAPTHNVYIPFELSDSTVAKIVGNKVLFFTPTNWNVEQNLVIDPISSGVFDINIRPLHSNDVFYNGHNPTDLYEYNIQAINITNLADTLSLQTGDTLDVLLNSISGVGSTKFYYKIIQGPAGFNVVEKSGQLSFRPTSNQIGEYMVMIQVKDEFGNVSMFTTIVVVTNGNVPDPIGKYVVPNAPQDPQEDGTVMHPFNNISEAIEAAESTGGNVFIRGGEYNLAETVSISTAAPSNNPIVIKPLNGEHVKINFDLRTAFEFLKDSRYIEIQGLEIDGGTDAVDFWCIVAQAFWGDTSIARGGGLAITLDGWHLTVKNNYIHDCYQKAVEIPGGRYVKVYDNIIHSIATTSLSGGHGIMRQQKGREYFDNDIPGVYRWDLMGNLIFNVEQRIYSWVPSKGIIEMVLDEGKPMLIDDPKDTDNNQENMSARIRNNALAFGSIDQMRLKSTPNLEVSNNAVFTSAPTADGITDKVGDTNTPQFINFIFKNNAVQTNVGNDAIEIQDAVAQGGTGLVVTNNYSAGGNNFPSGQSGLNTVGNTELFVDALNGNFHLNPALNLPNTVGVPDSVLTKMEDRKTQFGVSVKWDQWPNDHLLLTQTILDNIPGINDGISGNETVFTNFGNMSNDHHEIHFNVVNGPWKQTNNSPNTQDFHLNPVYAAWYHTTDSIYKNAMKNDYERIRWGDSRLKQNQVFDNDWLTVSQITSDSTNTVISGPNNEFVLDGDLLIDFEGYTPSSSDTFYLMYADMITSANTGNLFDSVKFEGYIPTNYSLQIVPYKGGQAVRLTLSTGCNLNVTSTADNGANSLRAALACAVDGDIITLNTSLANDTIQLTSTQLIIDKNITISSQSNTIFVQNCTAQPIMIATAKNVNISNFTILSDMIQNNGNLDCTNMTFKTKNSMGDVLFNNGSGATFDTFNSVRIE